MLLGPISTTTFATLSNSLLYFFQSYIFNSAVNTKTLLIHSLTSLDFQNLSTEPYYNYYLYITFINFFLLLSKIFLMA